MDADKLYQTLKAFQEKKGYYLNPDLKMTMPLMESLLANKERYGHMACPCRLASGNYEADKDIVCPCVYREADVAEYGTCFCGLYMSKDFAESGRKCPVVPERRPAEKVLAGLGF